MKIYHIRKLSGKDTDFRPTMLDALQSVGRYKDTRKIEVFIVSGFFDNNVLSFYDQTVRTNLLHELSQFSEVNLVGSYSGRNKLMQIKNNLLQAGINVTAYYKPKFHAKIFVIKVDGVSVFEIIGSSNMTNCAYCGQTSRARFSQNFEADLVICDDALCNVKLEPSETVMKFIYNKDDNNGISIQRRMEDVTNILSSVMIDKNKI